MKNKILILILFSFISITASAQTSWQWAKKSTGCTDNDGGRCITVDEYGNTYVAGYFYTSTITLDTILLNNFSNGIDIFVAKYDSSGNVIWAQNFGGNSGEFPNGIALDPMGNIYLTLHTVSTSITFGSINLVNTIAPKTEVFTIKLDNSGTVLWAKKCTGSSNDQSTDVTADKFGNCYVTGFFYGASMTVGSIVLTNVVTSGIQKPDLFIIKYDPSGNVVWAKRAGGAGYDEANSVTTDVDGEIYVAGHFAGPTISFGSFAFNGTEDVFVVKYDTSGNVLWAKQESSGNYIDYATSIAVDNNKNFFVGGYFNANTITIGNTTLTNATITNNMGDIFLVKYNTTGAVEWVKGCSGTSYDAPFEINIDNFGNAYMIGSFRSSNLTVGNISLPNSAPGGVESDIFIIKYSPSGNVVWARKLGGDKNDFSESFAVDTTNNHLYITGEFESTTLDLTPFSLSNTLANYMDFFIAKLNLDANSTGISENYEKADVLNVYPNPTLGNFSISFPYILIGEIEVFNTLGRLIHREKIHSEIKKEIHIKDISPGIYFLKVKEGEKCFSQKIIVKND